MTNGRLSIVAEIGRSRVDRETVLAWEAKRIGKSAKKIDLAVPTGTLSRQREAFCDDKLALAPAEIRRRLARDIRFAGFTTTATARLSAGRRSTSVCDLEVTGGDARSFVDWFSDVDRDDYERSMVVANPDHFLITTAPDGTQEVIETTGGSPLATRFFVDYTDLSSLVTPSDQAFPLELAGTAVDVDGKAIGGVRHQFHDVPGGFRARLCVEFPRYMAPPMVAEHRWHLACEFSNWIEAAAESR